MWITRQRVSRPVNRAVRRRTPGRAGRAVLSAALSPVTKPVLSVRVAGRGHAETTQLDPENYRKTKPVAWAKLAGFVRYRAEWRRPHGLPLFTGKPDQVARPGRWERGCRPRGRRP